MASVSFVGGYAAAPREGASASPGSDLVAAVALLDKTDLDAALGVLTADGVLPTEEHVTDATDAWEVLEPLIDAAVAGGTAGPAGDVVVTINLSTVTTLTKLDKVLAEIRRSIQGSGVLAG